MFIGEVDPALMAKLVEPNQPHSLYDMVRLKDHQSKCELFPDNHSSGQQLISTLLLLPAASLNALYAAALALWWHIFNGHPLHTEGATYPEKDYIDVPCESNTTLYLANTAAAAEDVLFHSNATCGDFNHCVRDFVVSSVPDSNLFFLVVDSTCGRCNNHGKIGNTVTDIPGRSRIRKLYASDYVKLEGKEKTRRNPPLCFGPSEEDNSQYGRGALVKLSAPLFIFFVFVSISCSVLWGSWLDESGVVFKFSSFKMSSKNGF